MVTNEKSTTIVTVKQFPRRSSRNVRMVQNFHLVWLDASIDENNNDCRNSISELREVINNVNTFTDVNECIDFTTDIKQKITFIITSEEFSPHIIPVVESISQVRSVYIFCRNNAGHKNWTQEYSKTKGVYTDITSICDALKQAVQNFDHSLVSISFVKTTDGAPNPKLDELDSSFMYTQILKEILLSIDFQEEHMNEFLAYCRQPFDDIPVALATVDKIEKEYHSHQPIWWYTCPSFLYGMLNRALRLMDIDPIIKMGFFVRDLHNHIAALHSEQCHEHHHSNLFTIYRGQGLSQKDFDQLKQTEGGLMSFNNFLSTSLDRAVASLLAESISEDPDLIGVLFEITIDPLISSCPFANVTGISYFEEEEEILFFMHSVFRIGSVKQIEGNTRLWQVDLTLTSDNDPQLHILTECIRKETEGSTGWERLGQLMMKLGQFNKAEKFYKMLFEQADNESEKAHLFHVLGCIKNEQGEYAEAAKFCEKSIEINQKILPSAHPDLATSYSGIGLVYKDMGEYSKALSYYEKVLEIRQKNLPANHSHLAISYNNIGGVYDNMGEYLQAVLYYEKGLEIDQKNLPANHPSLATSYNNIGVVHKNMGEYGKALSYYEEALEIFQKTLPASHPDFTQSYNNIGGVYYNMGEYSKALSYFERALEIEQKALSVNHSHLATFYNNIGGVYDNMGEYSKAVLSYEKATKIFQKNLPANQPHLASSYNNIGGVYLNMGEHTKALSYYEKALEIRQKNLPQNHPEFAQSYSNIGVVCDQMGEYLKALSYYKKALEIFQKILPENHPSLATSYNNIGLVFDHMGEYLNALSYYEKALEIFQKILPENHPSLAALYNNIAWIYTNTNDCLKALSYFQRALNIFRCSLPPNHPNIKNVRDSIKIAKKKL